MSRAITTTLALLALAATTQGCSTIHDRHAEHSGPALGEFTRRLASFETAPFVEIPTSIAWNTLYSRARRIAPIGHVDLSTLTLSSHWVYEPTESKRALNVQRRHRFQAQLVGDDRRQYRVTTATATEERMRELCQQEPGPWAAREPLNRAALEADLVQTLSSLGEIPPGELVFPGERETLWAVAGRVLAQEESAPRSAEQQASATLSTEWLTKTYAFGQTRLEVRSRVHVSLVPRPGGHSLSVVGELQHRAIEDEGVTSWVAADPAPLVAHVFAKFSREVSPLPVRLQPQEPFSIVDPASPMPDLPMPHDPLVGTYHLYVRAVQAPLTKPSGFDWDIGQLVAQLLPLVRQLNLTPVPTTQLARWLTGQLTDHLIAEAQTWIGRTAAPDLALVLTLRSAGTAQLVGPPDSHVMGWTDPIVLQLRGPEDLGFQLFDLDLQEHDFVAKGNVSLEALANTCGPTAVSAGNAVFVFELQRVGP